MAWPKSLRWRYSLRALFVFISLFALWAGYHADRARREQRAAADLEGRGATFEFHHGQEWSSSIWTFTRQAYPRFIDATWGERYVTGVHLVSALDRETAEAIADLPHLRSLRIESTRDARGPYRVDCNGKLLGLPRGNIPPRVMEIIVSNPTLRGISMEHFSLSGDDCRAVSSQTRFVGLSFIHCDFTEGGFARVIAMPCLHRVFIDDCSPTGMNLRSSPGSTSLESLYIHNTPIGLDFAGFIARSPNLRAIDLSSHTIDDEFVRRLGPHPNLEDVIIDGTLSDSCIDSLERMPALKRLLLPHSVAISARRRLTTVRNRSHPNQ